jgi:hypothetical protein
MKIQVIQDGEYVPPEELMAVGDPKKFWDGKAKERFPCRICNKVGHWKDECPQKGKPQREPKDRSEDRQPAKPGSAEEVKQLADKVDQMFKILLELKNTQSNTSQGNGQSTSGAW